MTTSRNDPKHTAYILSSLVTSSTRRGYPLALQIAIKAYVSNVPSSAARAYAIRRLADLDPVAHRLALNASSWHAIQSKARALVRSSSSLPAAARMRPELRKLAGALFAPFSDDVPIRRRPGAFRATAVIGLDCLAAAADPRPGYDGRRATAFVSKARLGVRMGLSMGGATSVMRLVIDEGRIVELSKSSAAASRFGLPATKTQDWDGLVDALAGDAGDADIRAQVTTAWDLDVADGPDFVFAAGLIQSAAHPAWRVDALGSVAFLVAVCDAVGLDASQHFGLARRSVTDARRHLSNAGVVDGCDLVVVLDAVADATGTAADAEADAIRVAESAAKRSADLAAVRAVRQQHGPRYRAGIAQALTVCGDPGDVMFARRLRHVVPQVVQQLGTAGPIERAVFRAVLRAALRKCGLDASGAAELAIAATRVSS